MKNELQVIATKDIHADHSFNGRDLFTVDSVADLASDIKKTGLIFPIVVRPMSDVPKADQYKDYKWSILAGFRRFTAISEVLQWEEVECLIKKGLPQELAKSLNLSENLNRNDLSPVEIGRAIRKHYPGMGVRQIAKLIGRDHNWVHRRVRLLDLPPDVIAALESGRITHKAALIIAGFRTREEQLEAFTELTKKGRRPGAPLIIHNKAKRIHRYRSYQDTRAMVAHLMEFGPPSGMSDELLYKIGKTLLWSMNDVQTEELLQILELPLKGTLSE